MTSRSLTLFSVVSALALLARGASGAQQFGAARALDTQADSVQRVAAADLDGDGDLEVLSASAADAQVTRYQNLGSGVFAPGDVVAFEFGHAYRDVLASDVDGDGDRDLILGALANPGIQWTENVDGLGAFDVPRTVTPGAVFRVAVADLDGDGDDDAVEVAGLVRWHANDGGGLFEPSWLVIGGGYDARDAHAADVDADGDLDLLTAALGNDQIAWHENVDGRGTFSAIQVIDAGADGATSVRAADLDGDGDLDVLGSATNGDEVAWYANLDGAGAFGAPQTITDAADFVYAATTGDADGDGDLDVLWAAVSGNTVAWHRNHDGLGSFGPSQAISSTSLGAKHVETADLDGDGAIDVMSASQGDDTVAWYPNQTCGVGLAATEVVRLGSPPNPAALLPGVSGPPVIGWSWQPIVDHASFLPSAVLDGLGITGSAANVPLPPFGTLLCDLASAPPLVLTSAPGSPFDAYVPYQCPLVGATLCAQAFATDGVTTSLTNALDVTIGAF